MNAAESVSWSQAEAWCRAMAEASRDALLIVDIEGAGTVRLVNAAAQRLFDRDHEALVGRPLRELLIPAQGADASAHAWQFSGPGRTEQPRRGIGRAPGGVELAVDVYETSLPPASRLVALTLRETTDRQPMDDTPSDPRSGDVPFRTLAESMPHMVWTCRGDGPCDYLSPQWERYTGIPAADQLEYRWLDQVHPEDVEEAKRIWGEAASAGGTFATDFRIRRHDGVHRWFSARAVPIQNAQGDIIKWVGTNTDIQELRDEQATAKELNEQLAQAVQATAAALEAARRRLDTATMQLLTAQRLTHVGSWEMEVATGEVVWSSELFRILGLKSSDTPPKYADQQSMFAPESWARLTEAVERAVSQGEGYELTLTVIRSDGELRTAVARAETLKGPTGTVEKLVGTFQDVTERDRVRATLVQLMERLQLATTAARIGVWDWDLNTGSLVWDDMMHDLHGTQPGDRVDVDVWRSFVHPDDLAYAEGSLQSAIQGPEDFSGTFRIRHANGTIRYIRAAAAVKRDAGTGEAQRMVGVNWDVTEQRMAECALQESRALLAGLIEHAGSGLIATDERGHITLFNRAAENLLGYRSEDLMGKPAPARLHLKTEVEARREKLERELGQPIQSLFEVLVVKARRGLPDVHEWTYVSKTGEQIPVLLNITCLRDAEGTILAFLGVVTDLRQSKAHERELLGLNRLLEERTAQAESASHAKSAFVANMSHEIRTPLGAITGITYLLSKTPLSTEQNELVRTAERSAKTLLGMINDILDLSKIEAQQLTLEDAPFDLMSAVDDIAGLMTGYAVGKNLELVVNVSPELPEEVVGDKARFVQIATNLTSNAIKFTEEGSVSFALAQIPSEDEGVSLRIDVRDTGPGIQPSALPELFNRFTQAEGGVNRPNGTGLGLAIVKQLTELMGGTAGAVSTPGVGSHFWCELPFGKASRPAIPRDEAPLLRVLVVDDHEAQRTAVQACAARLGWVAETAASGSEALKLLGQRARRAAPFDVIVLDWRMPERDGLQTLAELHELPESAAPRPSVVMTTAYEVEELRAQPGIALADGVLSKPVTSSSLYDAVAGVLAASSEGRHRLLKEHRRRPGDKRLVGARILVVDDSEVNRDIARRILELEGAIVRTASDGQRAVDLVAANAQLDAVLMDVQMPGMDGVEAVRQIRRHHSATELPVLALTAGAMASERTRALESGMNGFISKPFDPERLILDVRRNVERKRGEALPHEAAQSDSTLERSQWPELDGIDADDAFARLGGDHALFHTLLRGLSTDIDELSALLQAAPGERADLTACIHRLRGAAGNLGARKLHDLASEAERIDREVGIDTDGAIRESLLAELTRLAASIQSLTPAPAVQAAGSSSSASLTRFVDQLRNQDFGALSLFEELSGELTVQLGAEAHGRLRTSMERLDFPAALEVLQEATGL